jgi:hypothetical protein
VAPRIGEWLAEVGAIVRPQTPVLGAPGTVDAMQVSEPIGGINGGTERHVLVVGQVRVPYVLGSGQVTDPAGIATITAQLAGTKEAAGTIQAATPVKLLSIPASAIVTDADGTICVFTDAAGPGVPVNPVSSDGGAVDLPLKTGVRRVLVNPRDIRTSLSCGS